MARLRKPTATFLVGAAFFGSTTVLSTSPAFAVCYTPGVATSFNVNFEGSYLGSSYWADAVSYAINQWNATRSQGTGVFIYRNESERYNTIRMESYADNWYGLYNGNGITFSAKLNIRTIGPAATDDRRWVTSTSSHEFGHALRMGDNPSTIYNSIMKHSRNRDVVYGPAGYDIGEVKRCN
ncbi:zinc metalloprotease [Luteipulveratus halotolerans]|uniref:hypothetical protein n=1 Tax=Luteipulveratus halotolerans TaxID=1631356 RepID=UPI0006800EDA|nr:hypothetical protein [Luteipulveratus halotolerans]